MTFSARRAALRPDLRPRRPGHGPRAARRGRWRRVGVGRRALRDYAVRICSPEAPPWAPARSDGSTSRAPRSCAATSTATSSPSQTAGSTPVTWASSTRGTSSSRAAPRTCSSSGAATTRPRTWSGRATAWPASARAAARRWPASTEDARSCWSSSRCGSGAPTRRRIARGPSSRRPASPPPRSSSWSPAPCPGPRPARSVGPRPSASTARARKAPAPVHAGRLAAAGAEHPGLPLRPHPAPGAGWRLSATCSWWAAARPASRRPSPRPRPAWRPRSSRPATG